MSLGKNWNILATQSYVKRELFSAFQIPLRTLSKLTGSSFYQAINERLRLLGPHRFRSEGCLNDSVLLHDTDKEMEQFHIFAWDTLSEALSVDKQFYRWVASEYHRKGFNKDDINPKTLVLATALEGLFWVIQHCDNPKVRTAKQVSKTDNWMDKLISDRKKNPGRDLNEIRGKRRTVGEQGPPERTIGEEGPPDKKGNPTIRLDRLTSITNLTQQNDISTGEFLDSQKSSNFIGSSSPEITPLQDLIEQEEKSRLQDEILRLRDAIAKLKEDARKVFEDFLTPSEGSKHRKIPKSALDALRGALGIRQEPEKGE